MTFAEWWQAKGMRLFSENPMVLRSNPYEIARQVWDSAQLNMAEDEGELEEVDEPEAEYMDVGFRVIPEERRIGAKAE